MEEQTRINVAGSDAMRSPAIADLIASRDVFLRFVERRVSDRAAAEDILQTAYSRAVVQAGLLRNEDSAMAWFYRILRNAIIDFYRHLTIEERVVEPFEDGFNFSAPAEASESNLCPCIGGAIEGLRPAYAEIIRQVDLAESAGSRGSVDAFAKRSGITPGNAAVRVHRARKALEQSLRHTCGSCAGAGCLDCTCTTVTAHQG